MREHEFGPSFAQKTTNKRANFVHEINTKFTHIGKFPPLFVHMMCIAMKEQITSLLGSLGYLG